MDLESQSLGLANSVQLPEQKNDFLTNTFEKKTGFMDKDVFEEDFDEGFD